MLSTLPFECLFEVAWLPAPPGTYTDRPCSPERLAAAAAAGGAAGAGAAGAHPLARGHRYPARAPSCTRRGADRLVGGLGPAAGGMRQPPPAVDSCSKELPLPCPSARCLWGTWLQGPRGRQAQHGPQATCPPTCAANQVTVNLEGGGLGLGLGDCESATTGCGVQLSAHYPCTPQDAPQGVHLRGLKGRAEQGTSGG
jgi:hypothetical protein